MALTYTGANGLFTACGKLIREVNDQGTLGATTFNTDEDDINDILEASNAFNRRDLTALVRGAYLGARGNTTSMRTTLAGIISQRLLDRDTVLAQLIIASPDLNLVLDRLISEMVIDAQTVDASVVTVGAVSAAAGNTGNGTVLASKVLDGYSQPGNGMPAHWRYNAVDSELAVPSDTLTLKCIADSQRDGTGEGAELFALYGNPGYPKLDWHVEGSGIGSNVRVANGATLINNKDFEIFSGNIPVNWTRIAGTAGTHILQETTLADVYRGTSALRFDGDGATAPEINQAIVISNLKPRRRYNVSCRVKSTLIAAESGTLDIAFTGTNPTYTPVASEKISIAPGSYSATYALQNFYINMPATISADWKLVIKTVGNITNARKIWIDSLTMSELTWHNGIGLVVVAGATPFKRDDRFTFSVTNDAAGTFQEFWRKFYGRQLPSNAAGAETILDSLAE